MTTIRELLEIYDIEPKKSLGQNFMHDPAVLASMAEAADVQPGDVVLEIGPGLGLLTDVLVERGAEVVAVELDEKMVHVMHDRFGERVDTRHGDILRTNLADLMLPGYKCVANVPYYITSAILRHVLENPHQPSLVVVTVQKEVAERITATPGDMSLLAVSVQFFGAAEMVRTIGSGAFYPAPNVTSAVLRITPHEPPLPWDEVPAFFRVVKAGFSQPRKQMKKPLAAGLHVKKAQAAAWMEAAGIEPRRRPEKLSVQQWVDLYRVIRDATT